eukprot:scaffold68372_cov64-Phaeocystis_antarctica.AAC.2
MTPDPPESLLPAYMLSLPQKLYRRTSRGIALGQLPGSKKVGYCRNSISESSQTTGRWECTIVCQMKSGFIAMCGKAAGAHVQARRHHAVLLRRVFLRKQSDRHEGGVGVALARVGKLQTVGELHAQRHGLVEWRFREVGRIRNRVAHRTWVPRLHGTSQVVVSTSQHLSVEARSVARLHVTPVPSVQQHACANAVPLQALEWEPLVARSVALGLALFAVHAVELIAF